MKEFSMEYQPPRAGWSASERPNQDEARQVAQAIILGRMQDRGVLDAEGEEFGRVLADMFEDKSKEMDRFRGLFSGIARSTMNDPQVRSQIDEIEKLVRERMEESEAGDIKRAA